jgi:hypothetical protein
MYIVKFIIYFVLLVVLAFVVNQYASQPYSLKDIMALSSTVSLLLAFIPIEKLIK